MPTTSPPFSPSEMAHWSELAKKMSLRLLALTGTDGVTTVHIAQLKTGLWLGELTPDHPEKCLAAASAAAPALPVLPDPELTAKSLFWPSHSTAEKMLKALPIVTSLDHVIWDAPAVSDCKELSGGWLAKPSSLGVQQEEHDGKGVHTMSSPITNNLTLAPPVDLMDALALGDKVHGTDKNGDYIYAAYAGMYGGTNPKLAADKAPVRLAVRLKPGGVLTARLEGACTSGPWAQRLTDSGLLIKKNTHWSATVQAQNPVQGGAFYAALLWVMFAHQHLQYDKF